MVYIVEDNRNNFNYYRLKNVKMCLKSINFNYNNRIVATYK